MFWGEERSSLGTGSPLQLCHGTEVLLWFERGVWEAAGWRPDPMGIPTPLKDVQLYYTCKNLGSESTLLLHPQ